MLYKFLYYMDLFKTPLTLLFNRRRFISTKLGLFCTAFILTIIIIMVSKSDIYAKALPTILSSNLHSAHRPLIEFDQRIIAVGVQDDTYFEGFVDPGVFSIKVTNYYYNSSSNGIGYVMQAIDKPMHVCRENDFNDPNVLTDLGLQNNYCFDKGNSTFQMEGFFDEPEVKFITIELYLCTNISTNGTCKSQDEIDSLLNGKTFNIYFQDAIVNSKDHEHPIQNNIVNKYSNIDVGFHKSIDLYFQTVNLISDEGLIFSDWVKFHDIAFTTQDSDFYSLDGDHSKASRFVFNLYSDKKQQNIQRSYMKIGDLLARLGGVTQIMMILAYIFIYLEQSLFLKNTILNALYIFQTFDNRKQAKKQDKDNSQGLFFRNIFKRVISPKKTLTRAFDEIHFQNSSNNNDNNDNRGKNANVKAGLNFGGSNDALKKRRRNAKFNRGDASTKELSLMNFTYSKKRRKIMEVQEFKGSASTEKVLTFGIFNYIVLKIKSLLPCFKLQYNEELFKRSEEIYEKELDFIEIIKKIQDIDKLRSILLDPHQQILFNFLSKPLIHLNSQNPQHDKPQHSINLNRKQTYEKEDLKKALEHFEGLKFKGKLKEIDVRLLEILNKDVKNYKF